MAKFALLLHSILACAEAELLLLIRRPLTMAWEL